MIQLLKREKLTRAAELSLYVKRLLKGLMGNAKVVRYLAKSYPEILSEFQKIVESRSLDDTAQPEP